jgi:hypothetical protein
MTYGGLKRPSLALALALVAFGVPISTSIAAPSAELAIKCRDMMIRAYPPVRPGSLHGNAQKEREYFRACIARKGNMEEPPSTVGRGSTAPDDDSGKPGEARGK